MEGYKSRWASKGFTGSTAAALGGLVGLVSILMGKPIDLGTVNDAITAGALVASTIGGTMGAYGRLVAKKQITRK